jgi:hypothetical protein
MNLCLTGNLQLKSIQFQKLMTQMAKTYKQNKKVKTKKILTKRVKKIKGTKKINYFSKLRYMLYLYKFYAIKLLLEN